MRTGFDDQGNVIGTTDFTYPDDDAPDADAEDETRLRRETVTRMVALLVQGGDAKTVGARVLFLAYILRVGDCPRQKDLAQKLGITEGRVSQKLKKIGRDFRAIARIFAPAYKPRRSGI